MGVRAVNGAGELIHSGGRVLKNVTGLDLCKLLAGSHGTLAVITEVTLKVLPAPEADRHAGAARAWTPTRGVAALSAALGSPYGVSGAAWLPAEAAAACRRSAARRTGRAAADRGFRRLGRLPHRPAARRAGRVRRAPRSSTTPRAAALWRAVRDVRAVCAAETGALSGASRSAVARRPAVVAVCAARSAPRCFLDWGGGLVWLAGRPPPTPAPSRSAALAPSAAAR